MIEKYKSLIKSLYNKIKESIINNNESKKEKFSIIKDIYEYLINYNNKYKSKINIHLIIQGEKDELKIINKISNYLVEMFFNIEVEEKDNDLLNNNINEINSENANSIDENFNSQYENENKYIQTFEETIEKNEIDDMKDDDISQLDEF